MFDEKQRDYIMIGIAICIVVLIGVVSKNKKTENFFDEVLQKK